MTEQLPTTYDDLADWLSGNGDLATVRMQLLRDIHGAGKLGAIVRQHISDALHHVGIAHVPETLPSNHGDLVRIYSRDAAVGTLIRAVHELGPRADAALRDVASRQADAIVREIRRLLQQYS